MRKHCNNQRARCFIVVMLLAMFFYGIYGSINTITAAAENGLVWVCYVYNGSELTYSEVQIGSRFEKTIDTETYREDANLPANYDWEWYINDLNGTKWTPDYTFNENTTLVGKEVLITESGDNTHIEFPDEKIETPKDSTQPPNENTGENSDAPNGTVGSNSDASTGNNEVFRGVEESSGNYTITVSGSKDNYVLSGVPKRGEKITIKYKPSEGTMLDSVTIFWGNVPIVFGRKGDEISFYMPDGDVEVEFSYTDKSQQAPKDTLLTKQEIIALSLVGAVGVISGIYFTAKAIVAKKKTAKKSSK